MNHTLSDVEALAKYCCEYPEAIPEQVCILNCTRSCEVKESGRLARKIFTVVGEDLYCR